MRTALLYEHPTWSRELIARITERELDITPIDVGSFPYDSQVHRFELWVNRVNAMPSAGRPDSIVAATGHLLLSLELHDQVLVNGSQTHHIGGSKLAQAALFRRLGMGTPASSGIYHADQAIAAAETIGFPVLTKPNVGGSGNGIVRHDSSSELQTAIRSNVIDLGIDGTGVVQRVIESADGLIYRIEMLGPDFFYGTKQPLQADAFNYCAADGCSLEDSAIQLFTPPASVIEQATAVMAAAQTDVGGVEYIIDKTTGHPSFFDFNPYSNFVSGFDAVLGFNPSTDISTSS